MILIPRPSALLLPPVAMEGGDFVNDTQVNRDRYVEVIVELLKKANVEKLDLIWTFAKGIIR